MPINILRTVDIPVALRLAQSPGVLYTRLASDLALAPSLVHSAVQRLRRARLVDGVKKVVNPLALLEFIVHGVRYAFSANLMRETKGIPTAHAGPLLANRIVSDDAIVWPYINGPAFGLSIHPLYPQAVLLPKRCPELYEALTLVDAIRVGRSRERELAEAILGQQLLQPASSKAETAAERIRAPSTR